MEVVSNKVQLILDNPHFVELKETFTLQVIEDLVDGITSLEPESMEAEKLLEAIANNSLQAFLQVLLATEDLDEWSETLPGLDMIDDMVDDE